VECFISFVSKTFSYQSTLYIVFCALYFSNILISIHTIQYSSIKSLFANFLVLKMSHACTYHSALLAVVADQYCVPMRVFVTYSQ